MTTPRILLVLALAGIGAASAQAQPWVDAPPLPPTAASGSAAGKTVTATAPSVDTTSLKSPVATATSTGRKVPQETRYNELKAGTTLNVPDNLRTVQQAANYLLTPTGYSLVVPTQGFREAAAILNRPVTLESRQAGFASIESALLIIAGDDVRLVVDHANKLVSFEPNT